MAYVYLNEVLPYVMTVQVDELVINEGLLNRSLHFIVCIDTSRQLWINSIGEPTIMYLLKLPNVLLEQLGDCSASIRVS